MSLRFNINPHERTAGARLLSIGAVLVAFALMGAPPRGRHSAATRGTIPSINTVNRAATTVDAPNERILRLLEGAAVAAVFGVLFWLMLPIASAPSLYPDSGTVLSISMTLARGDFGPVWETQSPPVQDAMYAAMLRAGFTEHLNAPVVFSSILLCALLGYLMYRGTGFLWSAAVPTLVLMTSNVFWLQSGYLTLYSAFALVGYAGMYACVRYQVRGGRTRELIGGALLLAMSPYVFTTGLIFLVVPGLAAAVFFSRRVAVRTVRVYAMITLFVAPWIAWHLAVGGLSKIYYHPLNWFTVKYLAVVNRDFWSYRQESLLEYARQMGSVGLADVVYTPLLVLMVPGLWYAGRRFGARAAALALVAGMAYLAVLLVTRPAPFARYYYPVLPLVVLLVSTGIVSVVNEVFSARRGGVALPGGGPALRISVSVMVVMCGILAGSGIAPGAVADAQFRFSGRLDESPGYREFLAIREVINENGDGVIARDSAMQALLPDNQMYTHFLLTEEEYVTFLTWTDEDEVIDVLESRDIGWVLLRNEVKWEREYHVWLREAYGKPARHFEALPASRYFQERYRGEIYTLYQLNAAGKPES